MVLADEQVYKSLIIINLTVFIYTLNYFHVISQRVKIHATVKKDLVTRYAPKLTVGEWKFIEKFGVTPASGHFRPTSHLYKMVFHNDTTVLPSESISESNYLALVKFKPILARELKTYTLVGKC